LQIRPTLSKDVNDFRFTVYDSYIFAMRTLKDLGLYEIRGIHYYLYKYETDTLDRGLMISEICYFCIR